LPLFRGKFIGAGGAKHRAPALDNAANITRFQRCHIASQQTDKTIADAINLATVKKPCTRNCANAGVHSRGIASGSQYAYSLYLSHGIPLPKQHRNGVIVFLINGLYQAVGGRGMLCDHLLNSTDRLANGDSLFSSD
jgi:hypothetical protein